MQSIDFEPSYRRESGLWSLDLDSIPVPHDFPTADRRLVTIPAGVTGGNHRHPRREGFVALTPGLTLFVESKDGVEQFVMHDGGSLKLWIIPPMLAHAVVNTSTHDACMYEVADGEQIDVERVQLVS